MTHTTNARFWVIFWIVNIALIPADIWLVRSLTAWHYAHSKPVIIYQEETQVTVRHVPAR